MEILNILTLVLISLAIAQALPAKSSTEPFTKSNNYASRASQIISTNLLKSYNDIDGNQVHSPLGIAVELAVLAEAANGDTYDEFNKVFGYPKERNSLRASYKHILSRYQKRDYGSEPSFQTWLYIYRNYSAREEFKQILQDNYFVEVKDINRGDYDWSEPNTSLDAEVEASTSLSNSKDVIDFETLKRRLPVDDDDEDEIGNNAKALKDTYGEEVLEKEASKFDRNVEEKQYVEKPVLLEEIKETEAVKETVEKENDKENLELTVNTLENRETKLVAEPVVEIATAADKKTEEVLNKEVENSQPKETQTKKREDQLNIEENETVSEDEKMQKSYEAAQKITVPIQNVLDSNEPEKVSIPLQKLEHAMQAASKEPGEIMLALESHLSSVRRVLGARSLFNKDDITAALSANSITGREIGSKTKMLLFNGLYYRGNWANGFRELRDDAEKFFFMTAEDAMKTTMMHARGNYHTADLEQLNAKALCLPYENKKYTLLLIVPNDVEGLHTLIDKLQPADLTAIRTLGKEKLLHVILPKFQVEETSRSESMLKSIGLRKLFSREEADLSLLADDKDVHVDEIVQFVNIRVDEGGSSEGAISATNTQGRTPEASVEETFEVNRPFLYFVMDCEEEFVIVSGKISMPEYKEEEPITIQVEYEQA